jgi:UDP-hydrolysing UDP-N-acetyl-D-glucosamine 2-epimerase
MTSKHRILFYSSSRSDFGVLEKVILALNACSEVEILITGSHTLPGNESSMQEVLDFCIANNLKKRIIPFKSGSKSDGHGQLTALTDAASAMSQDLQIIKPDLLVLLGDRWELFAASLAALLMRIPIAHISGGEVTSGAIDDSIRHAHTKLAHLHFVACEKYAHVVSLLGEEDWRITISGELGLDWIHASKYRSPDDVWNDFNLPPRSACPLLLLTYHPTSYGDTRRLMHELSALRQAMKRLDDFAILITGPGLEQGADIVRTVLCKAAIETSHVHYVEHLGRSNYLALMRSCAAIIGNSSSGIVEAPSVGVPSLDIGDRQRGRERAESVSHCEFDPDEIVKAVHHITSADQSLKAKIVSNPYDPFQDGRNSQRIAYACIQALETVGKDGLLHKEFSQSCNPQSWSSLLSGYELRI